MGAVVAGFAVAGALRGIRAVAVRGSAGAGALLRAVHLFFSLLRSRAHSHPPGRCAPQPSLRGDVERRRLQIAAGSPVPQHLSGWGGEGNGSSLRVRGATRMAGGRRAAVGYSEPRTGEREIPHGSAC